LLLLPSDAILPPFAPTEIPTPSAAVVLLELSLLRSSKSEPEPEGESLDQID